jgi:O-antigen biosynthesis protein
MPNQEQFSLREIYAQHLRGKVSDKWGSYLSEYDKIFSSYRNKSVSLLEIGIQNGGSLDLWARYFSNTKKLIGCDIDEKCRELVYENPKISVVVGDANLEVTRKRILDIQETFDIIIEDGSHVSKDIILSFCSYFGSVKEGGVYIAEDLHCSYWQEYDGGIFHPFSAINFFKLLIDWQNKEHWGLIKDCEDDFFAAFSAHYGFNIDTRIFDSIHSIEFVNSLCIITKDCPKNNVLGERIIVGSEAIVDRRSLQEKDACNSNVSSESQMMNKWSQLSVSPVVLAQENQRMHEEIRQKNQRITLMESSKFWRIREGYMSLKKIFS